MPDDFQKEMDARTLAEAGVIKGDASRLAGAKSAAGKLLEEREAELKALRNVVADKPKREAPKRPTMAQGADLPITRTVRDRGGR